MKNEWLFSYKIINGVTYRLYDNRIIGIDYTFHSEYKIFLENMINMGLKVFYIETLPNHNFEGEDSYFEFFYKCNWDKDFIENFNNQISGYEMPESVKILREYQSSDLIPFYDDFIAESLFVISKFTDNLYHFNLVVCVKSELKLQNFLKNDFKTIKVKRISNILIRDLTYNGMSSTFNFNELEKFKNTEASDPNYYGYSGKFHRIETKESIDFENYKDYCMDKDIDFKDNPIYDWYQCEYMGKISEMRDHRFIFQNESKNFGGLGFFLEYSFSDEIMNKGYTYPINKVYAYIPHESEVRPMAIVNSDGKQLEIKDYEYCCMLDMVDNIDGGGSPFKFHFIDVQGKKYKTSFKQRLRLFENKNEKK